MDNFGRDKFAQRKSPFSERDGGNSDKMLFARKWNVVPRKSINYCGDATMRKNRAEPDDPILQNHTTNQHQHKTM